MTPAAALAELRRAGVAVRLGPGGVVALDAAQEPPAVVLALARAHRDGIRALLEGGSGTDSKHGARAALSLAGLPGVPQNWRDGVAALATMLAPSGIAADRWGELARTSGRLVRDHGAALHAAGWRTLDVFGLHALAPATYCPGWGLAWLLGARGDVLDVETDVVGMRREPGGARLAFRRRDAAARLVAAWSL